MDETVSVMDFKADEGETRRGEEDDRLDERLSNFDELDVSESSSSESTTGSIESPTEERHFEADRALGGTVANCRRDNAAEEASNALIMTL